jgi:hypothetical protein
MLSWMRFTNKAGHLQTNSHHMRQIPDGEQLHVHSMDLATFWVARRNTAAPVTQGSRVRTGTAQTSYTEFSVQAEGREDLPSAVGSMANGIPQK